MADYIPSFKPGASVTFPASDDVIGGRLVDVTGDRTVAHAAAGSAKVAGVAGFDTTEGDRLTVFTRAAGVHGLTAGGNITAGAAISAGADGKAVAATAGDAETPGTPIIGIALAAAATDDVVDVLFI